MDIYIETNELSKINTLHTLGPFGTNCEAAAYEWFKRRGRKGTVILYRTLEEALKQMPQDANNALLGCVVYPHLHTLVFSNLDRFYLADCFIMPTFSMLLASHHGKMPKTVSTHPAPQILVPSECEYVLVSSNAQAAADCAANKTDGCITTLPCAEKYGLYVIEDYGQIPMGFTIHVPQKTFLSRKESMTVVTV
jgi:prephenate dehydratase